MIRLIATAILTVCATAAAAQTRSAEFTLPDDIYRDDVYRFVSVQPVEADGNPATGEWLIHEEPAVDDTPCVTLGRDNLPGVPCVRAPEPIMHQWYRVVSVRAGVLCRGAWFRASSIAYPDATMQLTRINGRDRFLITERRPIWWGDRGGQTVLTVIDLDAPACPS